MNRHNEKNSSGHKLNTPESLVDGSATFGECMMMLGIITLFISFSWYGVVPAGDLHRKQAGKNGQVHGEIAAAIILKLIDGEADNRRMKFPIT